MKIRSKIIIAVLLLTATMVMKAAVPEVGTEVGRWIAGENDSKLVAAVSDFISSISDGSKLSEAVEVFCEALENH